MNRPKTIFCDIDGTLIAHMAPASAAVPNQQVALLPGTLKKLQEWDRKGYNIILTTGRKPSMRYETEKQLARAGIMYDELVMGIGGGQRIIINDLKEHHNEPTAIAINLKRNEGIGAVEI